MKGEATVKPTRVGASVLVVEPSGDVARRFLWLEAPEDFARDAGPELASALVEMMRDVPPCTHDPLPEVCRYCLGRQALAKVRGET